MRSVYRRVFSLSFVLLLIVIVIGQAAVQRANAQDITLTLAVSAYQKELFTDALLADFEAENPGIKVELLTLDSQLWAPPLSYGGEAQLPEFFDKTEQFASSGDVIQLEYWGRIPPESTIAGYFLNLKPLADADATLNSDDFYKGVWQFYQWDDGLWAIPYQATTHVVSYDPAAFDAAGLKYPDTSWTLADFANAARTLMVKDANGKVITKGLDVGYVDEWYLIRSLLGEQGLADTTIVPNLAQFSTNSDLQTLLLDWFTLKAEGAVGPIYPQNGGMIEYTAPLAIDSDWRLSSAYVEGKRHSAAVLLPGERAGLEMSAFAVSAGTQHPEAAYQLTKFLTMRPEMYANYTNVIPARRSLADSSPNSLFSSTNTNAPSAEIQDVLKTALDSGFSLNDVRYFEYLFTDISQKFPAVPVDDGTQPATPTMDDVITVMQTAEERANALIPALTEHKETLQITVATPVPVAELPPGKVAIKFGLLSNPDFPKKAEWEAFMKTFVEEDPQVGRVDLEVSFGGQSPMTDVYDCFYVSSELLAGFDRALLLPIDPYLDADSSIDKADFIGPSLSSFQVNNMTYGMPLVIEPELLRLDKEQFEKAGVPLPNGTWEFNAFLDALDTLKTVSNDPDKPMFGKTSSDNSGGYLMALIAAAGALPIDPRTVPLTFNFEEPATVDAIRQVLDLAKTKKIAYSALSKYSGANLPPALPIYTDRFSAIDQNFRMVSLDDSKFATAPYPSGAYKPLLYNVAGVFISANAQNPEGCYRLMSKLSQTPSLFTAMPARRSALDDASFEAVAGAAQVAAYRTLADYFSDPDAIRIPSIMSGGYKTPEGYYVERWLFRAFDRYVLEDANLETELSQAQNFGQEFMSCTAGLAPLDLTNPTPYYEGVGKCVDKVDPTIQQQN